MKLSKNQIYYLLAIIACFLWATPYPCIKIGLEYVSPIFFAGMRFCIAGVLVLLFALIKYRFSLLEFKKATCSFKVIAITAFLQTFLMYALYYIGMDKTPGAFSAILMGATPLVVALMSHFAFNNDKLSIKKIISLFIGIGGIVLLSLEKQFDFDGWNATLALGILLLFLSVMLSGGANIYVKKAKTGDSFILTGFQLLLGGVGLLLFSLFFEKVKFRQGYNLPISFFLLLLWLSIVSAVAFSLWYYLLTREGLKVSDIIMWKFLIPVLGAILTWILLKSESPDFFSIVGICVVPLSIVLYFFKDSES